MLCRRLTLRLLLLLLLVVCGGCSNDPNPQPLHKTRADGTPWVTRYWYMPDEARSLDPQIAYDQMSKYILEPVYDCLMQFHPMKTDPYEAEPCLLEEVPEKVQNADGTVTYLGRLQKGIFFHDDVCFPGGKGRELVASDLQYVFQRLSDPQLQSPIFANLAEYVRGMNETFEAAQKANKFDYDRNMVSGLEVLDAHTFKLHLVKPYPQILYWLALPFTAPVAREAVEYYDGAVHPDGPGGESVTRPLFRVHPVGTGAFRVAEWVPGQRYRLERNPGYHTVSFPTEGWPADREAINRPLAGRAIPFVDEVQLTIFKELLPIWLLTRQGYLDKMGVMKDAANSALSSRSELTPQLAERGMKLTRVLEPSTFFLVFNMQDPLLGKNQKLRQAISCAYDPQGYVDILYGGVAPVAQQLVTPGIFGFDKDFRNPYGHDLEKGKRLLAEAGYPGGIDPATGQKLRITMDVTSTGGEERQLAEYEQRELEQLGISVQIIENTFARTLEKEDQGNFQIASSGWGADYPDAENFLFLFTSTNFPPTGKNVGRYKNEEFDKLFTQMANTENSPERYAIIQRMNAILVEDCPFVLNFNKGYYVISPPWAPLTQTNSLLEGGLKYLPVDAALREQKRREWNHAPLWPIVATGGLLLGVVGFALQYNRRRSL